MMSNILYIVCCVTLVLFVIVYTHRKDEEE